MNLEHKDIQRRTVVFDRDAGFPNPKGSQRRLPDVAMPVELQNVIREEESGRGSSKKLIQDSSPDHEKPAADRGASEKESSAQSRQAMIDALTSSSSSKNVMSSQKKKKKGVPNNKDSPVSARSRNAMRAVRSRHAGRMNAPIRSPSKEEEKKNVDRKSSLCEKEASDQSRQAMINALFASKRRLSGAANPIATSRLDSSTRGLDMAPRPAKVNPCRSINAATESHRKGEDRRVPTIDERSFSETQRTDQSRQAVMDAFFASKRNMVEARNTTSRPSTAPTKSHQKEENRKAPANHVEGSFSENEKSDQSRQAMMDAFFASNRNMVEVRNATTAVGLNHSTRNITRASRPFQGDVSRAQVLSTTRRDDTEERDAECAKTSNGALDPPSSHQTQLIKPGAVAVRGIDGSSHLSFAYRSKTALRASVKNPFGSTIMEIEANVVDEEADREIIAEELRLEMMRESAIAEVVATDEVWDDEAIEKKKKKKIMRRCCRLVMLLLAIVLGLALGFGLTRSDEKDESLMGLYTDPSSSVDTRTTLEIVQERGFVSCGTNDNAFGNYYDDSGNLVGIFAEHCKAVALLALGDASKVKQVRVSWTDRFQYLANKTVDLFSEGTTHNMNRDIQEPTSMSGLSFSTSWVYSGLSFGGVSTFVDCADALDTFHQECRALKVCVTAGSTHVDILLRVMRGTNLHFVESTSQLDDALASGDCNVVAGEPPFLVALKQVERPDWKWGSTVLSKEPMALVTRDDDPAWTALVNRVADGLILAEAHGITKDNADEMADLFVSQEGNSLVGVDEDLVSQLVSLVSEFGNLGDMYRAEVEQTLPRNVVNEVYKRGQTTTGLLYSFPFGSLLVQGPGPIPNGMIDTILKRGYLNCGVHPWRGPGFAARGEFINPILAGNEGWSGFDVQFCQGIAAALFAGDIEDRVAIVEMQSILDSYGALNAGAVDLVAGARVSLQAQSNEPSTSRAYKFSTPYYYETENNHDAFALMTRREDVQWSDFVYWIVHASIYAEEQGITAATSADMPVVELFGSDLLQMFRDCIHVMGSLGELWNNTLQDYIPRTGANKLNDGLEGPLLYPIPAV